MQVEPAEADFAERYRRGDAQVVWTTLVADLETAVSAYLKIGGGQPMSFLLESVEGGAVRGRYSVIGLEPDLIWRMQDGRAQQVERDGGDREDEHAEPGVELHDAGPPSGASRPVLVGRSRPGVARIAFLDAPVRIRDQLRRSDPRNAERREGQADGRRRESSVKPALRSSRPIWKRVH